MNLKIRWMITLMIVLFSAELAPAKGQIVDGVVTPSTTLTIKSLIEAEYGDTKVVVCPKAVHKNIRRLTPCAVGYRAIVGRNRVIITHMWPAKSVEEFRRRAKLEPLEKEAAPSPNVAVSEGPPSSVVNALDETVKLLSAQVETLKGENEGLRKQVEGLMSEKAALEKEAAEFATEIAALKEERQKLQTEIERLNSAAVAVGNVADKEEISPALTTGQWLLVILSLALAVVLAIILVVVRRKFNKEKDHISRKNDELIAQVAGLREKLEDRERRLKKLLDEQGPPRPPTDPPKQPPLSSPPPPASS